MTSCRLPFPSPADRVLSACDRSKEKGTRRVTNAASAPPTVQLSNNRTTGPSVPVLRPSISSKRRPIAAAQRSANAWNPTGFLEIRQISFAQPSPECCASCSPSSVKGSNATFTILSQTPFWSKWPVNPFHHRLSPFTFIYANIHPREQNKSFIVEGMLQELFHSSRGSK